MYWRRIAELPGWLKAVMVGQLVSSAGALAWIYLTLYLVEDRGMSAAQAGFAAAAYGVGLLGGNLGRGGRRTSPGWGAAPGGPPSGSTGRRSCGCGPRR
jgi:predicted MFS family arabinose efflux permease